MQRSAFTLVELLVVISISAILMVWLSLDFRAGIQSQQMATAGDQLLALLQQSKTEVSAGRYEEEQYVCLGLRLELGEWMLPLQTVYNVDEQACDLAAAEERLFVYDSGRVQVSELEVGSAPLSPVYLFFQPPQGGLIFLSESGEELSGDLRLNFAHDRNDELSLNLRVDGQTGQGSLVED